MANASSVLPRSVLLGLRSSALRLSVVGCALSFVLCIPALAQIEVISGGNVGIGTTSPANRLHIDGTTGTPTSMPLRVDLGDSGSIAVRGSSSITYAGFTSYKDATQMWFAGREGDNYVVRTGGGANVLTAENAGAIGSTLYLKAGNVGIGTASPGYKLEVAGQVRATSFISNTATYADFVFKPDYKLPSLSEVEAHIAEHGTLPGVPSEAQVAKEGIDLAAMQVKLLQKVEELTLHAIAQQKEIATLRQELAALKNR